MVYEYPPEHLTHPTLAPQPWFGITCEEWPTVFVPLMQEALRQCNADKAAIRTLKEQTP